MSQIIQLIGVLQDRLLVCTRSIHSSQCIQHSQILPRTSCFKYYFSQIDI